jgi:NTP pyrophosphatase (non-canonical NTP hydrolase)
MQQKPTNIQKSAKTEKDSLTFKLCKAYSFRVKVGCSMHIHEFQKMMRRLYFHRDSKRGVDGTYIWLTDEVKELGDALKKNDKKVLEDEFADVIAWLASLANITNVNLEKAALNKYDSVCPKCKHSPCQCTF